MKVEIWVELWENWTKEYLRFRLLLGTILLLSIQLFSVIGYLNFSDYSDYNINLHNFRNPEKFLNYRQKLPIWSQKEDIMQSMLQNQVTIITGETGSGKTTQVPQFVLDHAVDHNSSCKIICGEPRRLGIYQIRQFPSKYLNINWYTGVTISFVSFIQFIFL